jgi:tape measure domain-containing protein
MAEEIRTVVATIQPVVSPDGVTQGVNEVAQKLKLLQRQADGTYKAVEQIGDAKVSGENINRFIQRLEDRFVQGAKQTRQYNAAIQQLQVVMEELDFARQVNLLEGINRTFAKLSPTIKLTRDDLGKLAEGAKTLGDKFSASAIIASRGQKALQLEIEQTRRKTEEAAAAAERAAAAQATSLSRTIMRSTGLDRIDSRTALVGGEPAMPSSVRSRIEREYAALFDAAETREAEAASAAFKAELDKVVQSADRAGTQMLELQRQISVLKQGFAEGLVDSERFARGLANLTAAQTRLGQNAERQAAIVAGQAAKTQQAYADMFGIRQFEQLSAQQRAVYERHWAEMLRIQDQASNRMAARVSIDNSFGGFGTSINRQQAEADARAAFDPRTDQNFQARQRAAEALIASYGNVSSATKKLLADERQLGQYLADNVITQQQYAAAMMRIAAVKLEAARNTETLTRQQAALSNTTQGLYQRNLILQSALVNTFQSVAAGQGVMSVMFIQATQAVGAFGSLHMGLLAVAASVAIVGAAFAGVARSIATVGDDANMARARIANFVGGMEEATAVYQRLQELGAQTGVRANEAGSVFTRLMIGGEQLGASTLEVERLLETFQKLGVLGSATTQELVAGMRQFTQALGKGKLDGDELRSVLENVPEVMRLISRQTGHSIEELRRMGAEGKLTSDLIFNAMLQGSEEVDRRFERLPLTMNRAMNQVRVAIEGVLDTMNSWLGLSDNIAQMLATVAQKLTEFRQWLRSMQNPEDTRNNAARATSANNDAGSRVQAAENRLRQAQEELERLRNAPRQPQLGDPTGAAFRVQLVTEQQEQIRRLTAQLEAARNEQARTRASMESAVNADMPRRNQEISLQQEAAAAVAITKQAIDAARATTERREQLDSILQNVRTEASINEDAARNARTVQTELDILEANIARATRERNALNDRDDGSGSGLGRILQLNQEIEQSQRRQNLLQQALLAVEEDRQKKIEALTAEERRAEARALQERTTLENAISSAVTRSNDRGGNAEIASYVNVARAVENYIEKLRSGQVEGRLLADATEAQDRALEALGQRYALTITQVDQQSNQLREQAQIRALEAEGTVEARNEIERIRLERQLENTEIARQVALRQLNIDLEQAEGPAKEKIVDLIGQLNAAYDRQLEVVRAISAEEAGLNRIRREGIGAADTLIGRINTRESIDAQAARDTRTVQTDLTRVRAERAALAAQIQASEGRAQIGVQERLNGLVEREGVLVSLVGGIERDRLKNIQNLNREQTTANARTSREIDKLERAIDNAVGRADRTGASREINAYRAIAEALEEYSARAGTAAGQTNRLREAQAAQIDVMADYTNRINQSVAALNDGTRDLEVQNQVRRLEFEGTSAARAEIDRITNARALERLELERQGALRQLLIDKTLAEGAALEQVEANIASVNAAYNRRASAISAPENQRSSQDLAEAQKRALDNATKESADFFYDAFSGKINDIGELFENVIKRGLADALAEEFVRPLLRPVIQSVVGSFSGAGGQSLLGGGLQSLGGLVGLGGGLGSIGSLLGFGGLGGGLSGGIGSAAIPGIGGAAQHMGDLGFYADSATLNSATGTTLGGASLGGVLGAAGLGFVGGGMVAGLTGGNRTGGGIGGGLGATAGFLVGGPLGGLIGGAAGGGLGGMFGARGNRPGFYHLNVAADESGMLSITGSGGKRADQQLSELQQQTQQQITAINQQMAALGLRATGSVMLGADSGDPSRPRGLNDVTTQLTLTAEDARIQGAINRAGGGLPSGLEAAQAASVLVQALDGLGAKTSAFADALRAIDAQFNPLIESARRLGFGEAELTDARQKAVAALEEQRAATLADYDAGLQIRMMRAQGREAEAATLEMTQRAAAETRAYRQELEQLGLTTEAVAARVEVLSAVQQAEAAARQQQDATRAWTEAIASAADRMIREAQRLREEVDAALLGPNSPLTGEQRLTLAQERFASGRLGLGDLLTEGARNFGTATSQYSDLFFGALDQQRARADALDASAASLQMSLRAPGFATGGSFDVMGPPGNDNIFAPMRVTAGETVNVSRRDTMTELLTVMRDVLDELRSGNAVRVAAGEATIEKLDGAVRYLASGATAQRLAAAS